MKNVNFEKDILVAIGAAIFVFLARNMLSMVSTVRIKQYLQCVAIF